MTESCKTSKMETSFPRISKVDKAKIMGIEEETDGIFGDIRYRAPEVI